MNVCVCACACACVCVCVRVLWSVEMTRKELYKYSQYTILLMMSNSTNSFTGNLNLNNFVSEDIGSLFFFTKHLLLNYISFRKTKNDVLSFISRPVVSLPLLLALRLPPRSQADLCVPRLNEGDQVVLINGRDISDHTHDQVVMFIKASCESHSGELILLVRPNGELFPLVIAAVQCGINYYYFIF